MFWGFLFVCFVFLSEVTWIILSISLDPSAGQDPRSHPILVLSGVSQPVNWSPASGGRCPEAGNSISQGCIPFLESSSC